MKLKTKNHQILFFAIVIVLAITFLFSGNVLSKKPVEIKEATLKIDNLKVSEDFLSPVYKPNFSFNMIGIKWQGDKEVDYQVRVYKDQWSEWYDLEHILSDIKDPEGVSDTNYSEPVFLGPSKYFQFRVSNSAQIDNLEVVILDTNESQDLNLFQKLLQSLVAEAQEIFLDIISRQAWQADESWRLNNNGNELWPAEYEQVKKIIIHHTAGSNGEDNPKAVVRGIYYWHAVSLGWGDIGYHYLIDPDGNIYEGRYGGDGVIGGHAYDEIRDVSYNNGTLGIAILGNFETSDILTQVSQNALTDLIAKKSQEFGFSPIGSSIYNNENLPNIIGHKDVDATLCPGKNIYNIFDELRQEAQDKYELLPSPLVLQKDATFDSQSEASLTLQRGEEREVWIDFKNSGNSTWKNYTESRPKLAVFKKSSLEVSSWVSDTLVADLATANVPPGKIGRYTFKIKAPLDKVRFDETFVLKWDDDYLTSATVSIHLEIEGLEYAANDFQHDILPATFPQTQRTGTIKYKNIGIQSWEKDSVYLQITSQDSKKNDYYHSSWPDELGKIKFSQNQVNSQEYATFSFRMLSPNVGVYQTNFKLFKSDGEAIPGSGYSISTRVDSTYQTSLFSDNIPVAVLNSWHVPVTLKFKNTGLATWDRNVVLNVYDGDFRNSAFSSKRWPTALGNFTFQETEVKLGQIATFNLTLYPPAFKATYYTIFKLEYKGNNDIIIQGGLHRLIRVDHADLALDKGYQAEFLSVSAPPAMLQLQRVTNEVKIRNTGTKTWDKDVVLNIYDADLRETYFRDDTWPAFSGQIQFRESQVRPGETATFHYVSRAPYKTGGYRNRFKLAISGKEFLIVPGSEDSWLTRVDPR